MNTRIAIAILVSAIIASTASLAALSMTGSAHAVTNCSVSGSTLFCHGGQGGLCDLCGGSSGGGSGGSFTFDTQSGAYKSQGGGGGGGQYPTVGGGGGQVTCQSIPDCNPPVGGSGQHTK